MNNTMRAPGSGGERINWRGPLPGKHLLDPSVAPYVEIYQADRHDGFLTVIVGKEPPGWHLSISHRQKLVDPVRGLPLPGRIPSYYELKSARYEFVPDDVYMAMIFPPAKDYVDVHPTTLHLHEIPAEVAR